MRVSPTCERESVYISRRAETWSTLAVIRGVNAIVSVLRRAIKSSRMTGKYQAREIRTSLLSRISWSLFRILRISLVISRANDIVSLF